MICRARPHCQRDAEHGDKFCARCRARLDDVIARCFPEVGRDAPSCEGLTDLEIAEVLGRYLLDRAGRVVKTEGLAQALGVRKATFTRARKIGTEKGWVDVRGGPKGGLVCGRVTPPEIKESPTPTETPA
jgi:hypothetical protein